MKLLLLFYLLLLYPLLQAQDAKTYDSNVPNEYYDFALKLVKETPGFTPPIAARAFGYMGLTLYEAVVPGIPSHVSTQGHLYQLASLTAPNPVADYHWPTVANNALAMILDSLFRTALPINKDSLYRIRDDYNEVFQYALSAAAFNDSKAFGEAIAQDIFEYSRTDGGYDAFAHNFPPEYVPPVGPSYWVPFGMQTAMLPYWGNNRPFLEIDSSSATVSPIPPSFSTDPTSFFYGAVDEVYTTNITLTPEQNTIALYWADGAGTITPGGHSISMLNNILVETNANLETAALAYAKLGIALSDAFLACWKTKYIYNLCRPVTYVHEYIDSTWSPLIGTPPFPEYPSGHSSQSGAMATIMSDMFGSDYVFTDSTNGTNFGGPRTFGSFEEAAQEAAISRLYGGIHYAFSNQAGLTLGEIVGENVNQLFAEINVGTKDEELAENIFLFPNPASDAVYIRSDTDDQTKYSMLDIDGRVLQTGAITNGENEIDLKNLPPGVYFLKTNTGGLQKLLHQ